MNRKKNLTLTLEEDLLVEARILAARRGTSVTKLVRRSLEQIVAWDQERNQANARLKALMRKPRLAVGNARWTREEIHERS